jgi:hypothetical protein
MLTDTTHGQCLTELWVCLSSCVVSNLELTPHAGVLCQGRSESLSCFRLHCHLLSHGLRVQADTEREHGA